MLVPPPDLTYVQLIKEKKGNRVVRVHKKLIVGKEENLAKVNTSYVRGITLL